jgi:glucose-1-phosphate cytidylyltransferase
MGFSMKVVILAGGFGTRLSEYTETIPKPMVPINGKPILWHIMQRYAFYGYKDFYLALGYKAEIIKKYFLTFSTVNSDFSIDFSTGNIKTHSKKKIDWNVTLIDTGNDSMTGGRVKRLKSFIGNEPFMLTYGDGVADIDINALEKYHKSHGKIATITAVHPVARFGELQIEKSKVKSFQEKPQVTEGWINGGFFVFEPEIFNLIDNDSTVLEKDPLEKLAKRGDLMAYKHKGFWQCMDTKRDKDFMEKLCASKEAPWLT